MHENLADQAGRDLLLIVKAQMEGGTSRVPPWCDANLAVESPGIRAAPA